MDRKTKNQLLAIVVVALLAIVVAWYAITRQTHYQYATLVRIDYTPPTGPPPYLTYTFSEPLIAGQVAGTAAVLKSFQVGADSPTPPGLANPFVELLTQGPALQGRHQGPAPFVPVLQLTAPNVITTNTLPSQVGVYASPMTLTGSGTMWFAVPKKR